MQVVRKASHCNVFHAPPVGRVKTLRQSEGCEQGDALAPALFTLAQNDSLACPTAGRLSLTSCMSSHPPLTLAPPWTQSRTKSRKEVASFPTFAKPSCSAERAGRHEPPWITAACPHSQATKAGGRRARGCRTCRVVTQFVTLRSQRAPGVAVLVVLIGRGFAKHTCCHAVGGAQQTA